MGVNEDRFGKSNLSVQEIRAIGRVAQGKSQRQGNDPPLTWRERTVVVTRNRSVPQR